MKRLGGYWGGGGTAHGDGGGSTGWNGLVVLMVTHQAVHVAVILLRMAAGL